LQSSNDHSKKILQLEQRALAAEEQAIAALAASAAASQALNSALLGRDDIAAALAEANKEIDALQRALEESERKGEALQFKYAERETALQFTIRKLVKDKLLDDYVTDSVNKSDVEQSNIEPHLSHWNNRNFDEYESFSDVQNSSNYYLPHELAVYDSRRTAFRTDGNGSESCLEDELISLSSGMVALATIIIIVLYSCYYYNNRVV